MNYILKIKDWMNSVTFGTCRVCGKELSDRYDNRSRMLCLRDDSLLIWKTIQQQKGGVK